MFSAPRQDPFAGCPTLSQIRAPATAQTDNPLKREPERPACVPEQGTYPSYDPTRKGYAQRWAELLARVFGFDMKKCADCGGSLKMVSAILEPAVIRAILSCLGLPDKPPGLTPTRIPEQSQFP